jgi:hypothetical protein
MMWLDWIEKILAGGLFGVCAVAFLRLVLPHRQRALLDAGLAVLRRWGLYVPRRWRARRLAHQALDTAKHTAGQWQGNVFTPKSFRPSDHRHKKNSP